MFSHASVILFTICLMDTWSLLILVGYSVTPCYGVVLLECFLVVSIETDRLTGRMGKFNVNLTDTVTETETDTVSLHRPLWLIYITGDGLGF